MKLLDLNRPISRGMKITILVAMALVSLLFLYSVGMIGQVLLLLPEPVAAQAQAFILGCIMILPLGLPSSVILGLIVGWKNQRILLGFTGGVVGGAIGGIMGFTGWAIFISPTRDSQEPLYFLGLLHHNTTVEEVLSPSIGGNLLGAIIIAWLLSRPKKPPLPDDSPETDGSDLCKTRRSLQ